MHRFGCAIPLRARRALALLAALAAVALCAVPAARSQPLPASNGRPAADAPAADEGTGPRRGVAGKFRTSVVRVDTVAVEGAPTAASLGARRSGSGVILEPRLVLTIGYLLLEAESVEVTTASGRRIPADVAGYDHATGFGLVRTVLPLDGERMELGDSNTVQEHQKLLTIGQGEDEATELYVLSRKPFVGSWEYLLERPIYTYPPVNNWSGSALITPQGKLVGIGSLIVNDAATEQRGIPGNLFVPVDLLKPILDDLRTAGRRRAPVQPWLGMATESVRGALVVVRVARDGPAESAGIDRGDVVLALDGEPVADQADFYRRLWRLGPAGTEVTLRLRSGGTVREIRLRSIDRMDVLSKPVGV
jgi:S1-C subfamily serine protease